MHAFPLLDTAIEDTQERCICPTPCNLTRYGKEISMVRIPNKGSARYLARKYNRNETYIRWVTRCWGTPEEFR